MYKIVLTRSAIKNIKKLDLRYRKAINKALSRLSQNPKLGDPLKGELKGLWKLRFSRYRIIYEIKRRKMVVIIFEIKHRKKVYK